MKKIFIIGLIIIVAIVMIKMFISYNALQTELGDVQQKNEDARQAVEVTKEQYEQSKMEDVENNQNRTIPGLTAADIKLNLENIDFKCVGPSPWSDELYSWECVDETNEYKYTVEFVGESPYKIMLVKATALNYNDNDGSDFLGYIASTPYDGAEPLIAKEWVLNNAGKTTDVIRNDVKFTIVVSDKSKILTLAHKDSDLD